MNEAKADERKRGGRPRTTSGRVTVRLPSDILSRLRQEPSMSTAIARALARWYGL